LRSPSYFKNLRLQTIASARIDAKGISGAFTNRRLRSGPGEAAGALSWRALPSI
jgi:hypothetical protein